MMNLFEMMAEAGERERLVAQGKALGLSDEQARAVVDTLGPAALAGLQRMQGDPAAMMRDMTRMGQRMMAGASPGGSTSAASPSAASPSVGLPSAVCPSAVPP